MSLEDLLSVQGGVVTHAQAVAHVSARQLRPGGRLVRLRQGAYADASVLAAAGPAERTALEVAAVRLTTGVDLVACGSTAAVLHGLPLLRPPRRVHVLERKEARPRHHGQSSAVLRADVVTVHGVPVTAVPRTVVDVARRRGFLAGVVVADAALAQGLDRAELVATAALCRRFPGVRDAKRAAAFADGRAESPLESLGRVRFDEHGLPPAQLQVVLGDVDGPFARVDHYWAEHRTVAEADGAVKYADPGDLFVEKRREDRLREAGFEVVRYTWDEALRTPERIVARILAAFARADRRAA